MSSKTKNELNIISLKGNSQDILQYKIYPSKFAHIKERAKQKYYHSVINDTKHNINVLWKTINDITHYKKRSNNSISSLVNEIGENFFRLNPHSF